jgi:hypothetical protein
MSEEVIAVVITISIIILFLAWVPFLNLVCPPCGRFLERRRRRQQKDVSKVRSPIVAPQRKAS